MSKAESKLVLKDYTGYQRLVSDAYLARPDYESQYVSSWKVLIQHSEKMFKQISTRVDIQFVDYDPYPNYRDLKEDVVKNKKMLIYTGHSEHPIFTKEQNIRFRAVHDYLVHIAGDHGFGLKGEIGAYNRHAKVAPPEAHLALFTEVIGQACTFLQTGSFPKQKITKLHGFDYIQVGKVDEVEYANNFENEAAVAAIKSPSKHIPLKRLLQIKQDNYIGEGGQEYSSEEVDQMILERMSSLQDKVGKLKREVESDDNRADYTWMLEDIKTEVASSSSSSSFLPERLVMLDCEMTGVDPTKHELLQAAFVKLELKNGRYEEVGQPLVLYFGTDAVPSNNFHKKYLTHIFEKCNASDLDSTRAKELLHEWLGDWKGQVTPTGDCVITDLEFLKLNGVVDRNDIVDDEPVPGTFHYEIFDLNAPKAFARHAVGEKYAVADLDENIHDALVDCRNQTKELNSFIEVLLPDYAQSGAQATTAMNAELESFLTGAGKSYYNYDRLMSKESDDMWAEQERFNEDAGTHQTREEWAQEQEEFHRESGDPSMLFGPATKVKPSEWLIHFTNANPLDIIKEGFKGRDISIIGLTTRFKHEAYPGPLALAYRIEDIPPAYRRSEFGTYGKNAIIFKAKEAARAYHYGDEEYQVVFTNTSAHSMYPVFDVYGEELELYDPKKLVPVTRQPRSHDGLAEILRRVKIKDMIPDETVAASVEAKLSPEHPLIKKAEKYFNSSSFNKNYRSDMKQLLEEEFDENVDEESDDDLNKSEDERAALFAKLKQLWAKEVKASGNTITCYRAISLEDEAEVQWLVNTIKTDSWYSLDERPSGWLDKYSGVGVFWSWSKKGANIYWGRGDKNVLIEAEIPLDSIDIRTTVTVGLMGAGAGEREIRAIEGAKVYVTKVTCNGKEILRGKFKTEAKASPQIQGEEIPWLDAYRYYVNVEWKIQTDEDAAPEEYFEEDGPKPRRWSYHQPDFKLYRWYRAEVPLNELSFNDQVPTEPLWTEGYRKPSQPFELEKYKALLEKNKQEKTDLDARYLDSWADEWWARKYAAMDTKAPDIVVHWSPKLGKYEIWNGRHRSRAAFLQGRKTINAVVGIPVDEAKLATGSLRVASMRSQTPTPAPAPLRINERQKAWLKENGAVALYRCHPMIFIQLCSGSHAEVDEVKYTAHDLDFYNSDEIHSDMNVHPFIEVRASDGKITSHEGRHRAAAVLRQSHKDLKPYEYEFGIIVLDEQGNPVQDMASIPKRLKGQFAEHFKHDIDFNLLTPLTANKATAGANGEWWSEGYKLEHEVDGNTIHVIAYDPKGLKCGELDAGKSEAYPGQLVPIMVYVDERHQRKGIATAMYQLAEHVLQQKFKRGTYQSPEAKKLWNQPNRAFGSTNETAPSVNWIEDQLNSHLGEGLLVLEAYVMGSFAKGDPNDESDIDVTLVVEPNELGETSEEMSENLNNLDLGLEWNGRKLDVQLWAKGDPRLSTYEKIKLDRSKSTVLSSVVLKSALMRVEVKAPMKKRIKAADEVLPQDLPTQVQPVTEDDGKLSDEKKEIVLTFKKKSLRADSFQDFQELLNQVMLEAQLTEDFRPSVAGILNEHRVAEGYVAL